jgi:hypothetical protein
MRKFAIAIAAAAMMTGSLATAQTAFAAAQTHDTTVYTQPPAPTVRPLDCRGGTGNMGCGPGWFWRDGWRGWGCYPC